ncbi:MAG: ABC transporter ATP-binding protein [Pseudomonadota bacterium]
MLASENVLEVNNVCKLRARSAADSRQRLFSDLLDVVLRRDLARSVVDRQTEFWALRNVSFSVAKGEAIGIVGRNGAGKTTLLRILAGQIPPDSGVVRLMGASEAMIDLAAGFNMSATGRKNVYIRGALLGRSRDDLKAIESEIVEFAELDDAIDAPLRTYSSGMLMRLAFSIVVHTSPTLLIIDEILAVGDFRFRQKCLAKIRDLRATSAFVFVSHSMNDVRNFCDTVLVLHEGEAVFLGEPDAAIKHYEEVVSGAESGSLQTSGARALEPQYADEGVLDFIDHHWVDGEGQRCDQVRVGEPFGLRVEVCLSRSLTRPICGVPVWNAKGEYVTGFSTQLARRSISIDRDTNHKLTLTIPRCEFNPGDYYSNVALSDGIEFVCRRANPVLRVVGAGSPYWGSVTLEHDWFQEC